MSSPTSYGRTGKVFDIQRWSLHDGPGIRTVVFLKGCPLRCLWCSNPESQEFHNELGFFKDRCIACLRCVDNCPHGAVTIVNEKPVFNREICKKTCYAQDLDVFPCTRECYSQALRAVAKIMTVDSVMAEVMKDIGIYTESKVGGLTVSGGEPLSQPLFVKDLLIAAKEEGITTAIETTGHASWSVIQPLLSYIDYFFIDIKAFDNRLHSKLVGIDNTMILENAVKISKFLVAQNKQITVRIPIVPNHTSYEDFKQILEFIRDDMDSSAVAVELMAYHRLGRNKYSDIGKPYELFDLEPLDDKGMQPFKDAVISYNLALV